MTSARSAGVALLGLAFVVGGVALGIAGASGGGQSVQTGFGVLIVLLAAAVAGWKVWGALESDGSTPPVPWADDEPFANPAPERTIREPPLSSDGLTAVVEEAGATARKSGTVDDGLDVLRPVLREALVDALVQGGVARADAEAAVSDGSWTDDGVAASVLEETISGPDRSFRKRVYAWLFPERVVRRLARRAMAAVADAADEALPTVPGQTAPRTVPVVQPRLEELTRGADGRLERAVDPDAVARGPRPPGGGPVDADSSPNDVDSISSKTDSSADETDANAGAVDGVRAAPTESDGVGDGEVNRP
ncbi:hypothetical protein [Natrialba sp. INN-245]|uniref:DUF7269 family protein n=1 Tax=Natrialba sp. INN-245 TaxID=2690967 RepID=UPI0013135907|nr:hypothetical protein [Natrialba sp. INN-245]MWV40321.1 hypothetical protein [Natrialba sp. INN-245]